MKRFLELASFLPALLLIALSMITSVVAGEIPKITGVNIHSCKSNALDWYLRIAGETPCATYAKLRQIANDHYTVPTFLTSAPGDVCNGIACSNSIAFSLSMLCMNCQQCERNGTGCVDAGSGVFESYVNGSLNVTNGSLTDDLAGHICNRRMMLFDFLFQPVPSDGSWSFNEMMNAANGSSSILSGKCAAHVSSAHASTAYSFVASTSTGFPNPNITPTSSPASSLDVATRKGSVGIAVGCSIGAVIVLVVVIGGLWTFINRRRRQKAIEKHRAAVSSFARLKPFDPNQTTSSFGEKKPFQLIT